MVGVTVLGPGSVGDKEDGWNTGNARQNRFVGFPPSSTMWTTSTEG